MDKYFLTTWTGYNSQDITHNLSRKQIVREIVHALAVADDDKDSAMGYSTSIVALEDSEFLTVQIIREYDYYGWRSVESVYTTRYGFVIEDDMSEYPQAYGETATWFAENTNVEYRNIGRVYLLPCGKWQARVRLADNTETFSPQTSWREAVHYLQQKI